MGSERRRLAGDARRLAVLGKPIEHSKSPALHAAAYGVLGLDWTYTSIEVDGAGLPELLAGLDASWRGLSLTMPLKQDVIPLVERIDRVASLTGAVNTVLFEADGRRLGFNTDVGGIVRALHEAGVDRVGRGAILGAGATAASVLAAIAELGCHEVDVFVRTPARAEPLVILGRALDVEVRVAEDGLAALARAGAADLVVSTVPGGTELPHEASVDLRRAATLFDVAYDPWPSRLATSWLDAGGRVVPGIGMLLHQAVLQVRIFVTGDPGTPLPDEAAVVDVMRAAVA
ncbi:shikimate dehydrogenase [Agromyces sp. CFH 90414]|uniref:Shikimate dehydrogenase n=1 Tax=Agromyces agglutinans TaxID=2662258 RepID=A0A6I2F1T8_9MICO|nr:shikimate dehydrogenase [Agromyces agglutinans]MRG58559.1 shikimate dehydrogenase [Agromyces agglutinans]